MNAVEPIADVDSAGPTGLAPDLQTGVDEGGHTTERNCLNCRSPLLGDYCHACGQKGHVHRSLGAFAHDLLHGVLHFEGKIWRTLPLLVWRPGELTRRYVDGQRASFVGPLPLFLFGVFLMFAVVGQIAGRLSLEGPDGLQQGMAESITDEEAELRRLEAERAKAAAAGNQSRLIVLDAAITNRREDLNIAKALTGSGAEGEGARLSGDLPEGLRALEGIYNGARKNPELLIFKLKTMGYKYSWALIPLSLPIMWLLFPFSRRWRLYDHTIFVAYSLCFMTLLVVAGSLWSLTGLGGTGLLLLLPPLHIYRQLRGAYLLSRASALWRTAVLTIGALAVALLFVIGLVLLGLFE